MDSASQASEPPHLTELPTQPAVMSADEWRAEGIRRFGEKARDWKFQCTICRRIFSLAEVSQFTGPNHAAECGYQECIGRVNGQGYRAFIHGSHGDNVNGCDFAAYGLITSGFTVLDGGRPIHVLPFAPMPSAVAPPAQVPSARP